MTDYYVLGAVLSIIMSGGYMCMIIIACHRLLNEPTPIIPAGNSNKVDWADFLKYMTDLQVALNTKRVFSL